MPFTTRGTGVNLVDAHGTLTVPLSYQGSVEHFTVPSGFVTDFASTPRLFQCFAPSIGKWSQAAVLHDWMCVHLAAGDCVVSSRDADGIFRRTMREAGVGFLTRWAMWTGVRYGALLNPARRAGWIKDAPAVLGITAAGLAGLLTFVYGVDHLAHALVRLI